MLIDIPEHAVSDPLRALPATKRLGTGIHLGAPACAAHPPASRRANERDVRPAGGRASTDAVQCMRIEKTRGDKADDQSADRSAAPAFRFVAGLARHAL
ncbi:hypothetical protein [Xanthomonas sp. XNM01]|uniref:hypothetical protein n=1 Tax=Xanthomonas sp. XNM01 TaxID=2769289 RepID=UPI00177E15F8|nr:hypothetical protein [Xanthomonas sp. XNM01]MBD9370990.1 hypothetical protein [Xanthomonas sp. XNM01]